jgi:hypothetical protein
MLSNGIRPSETSKPRRISAKDLGIVTRHSLASATARTSELPDLRASAAAALHEPAEKPHPPDACNHGNMMVKCAQSMKEDKSIDVMNILQMQIPEELKAENPVQMSNLKEPSNR